MRREVLDDCRWFYVAAAAAVVVVAVIDAINSHTCFFALLFVTWNRNRVSSIFLLVFFPRVASREIAS